MSDSRRPWGSRMRLSSFRQRIQRIQSQPWFIETCSRTASADENRSRRLKAGADRSERKNSLAIRSSRAARAKRLATRSSQRTYGQPTFAEATVGTLRVSNERRVAEREGFEPPEPFRVQWFSRPPPSTTRPSLRTEESRRLSSGDPLFYASAAEELPPRSSKQKDLCASALSGERSKTSAAD
jgi:hypothetical protein